MPKIYDMPAIFTQYSTLTWHHFQPGMDLAGGAGGAFGRWKTGEEEDRFDPTGL